MNANDALLAYVLRLGDSALIYGQRMIERVAAEPELEEELANANFALDYIGQARMYYTYAGELEGEGRDEDDFAYLRDEQAFRNFLMLEQPNGHFGDEIVRQVLFEHFYILVLEALVDCSDERLAAIAARAEKEIRYHLRHANKWLVRLGDGTDESHARVAAALENGWRYAGDFFDGDAVDEVVEREFSGPSLAAIEPRWREAVTAVIEEATLAVPDAPFVHTGSRSGFHSEHLGYLIAEMQHLRRAYPGATW